LHIFSLFFRLKTVKSTIAETAATGAAQLNLGIKPTFWFLIKNGLKLLETWRRITGCMTLHRRLHSCKHKKPLYAQNTGHIAAFNTVYNERKITM